MDKTRPKTEVYLLSSSTEVLTGGKLPSLRQVLGLFIHEHTKNGRTVREASAITIAKTSEFWNKARIPIRADQHCYAKLETEFESWRLLKKNAKRISPAQKAKESAFSSKLDNLFDIAHADALQTIKIPEDREFLIAQREEGRRGSMVGIDATLMRKENTKIQMKEKLVDRRRRAESSREQMTAQVLLASSSSSFNSSDEELQGATGGVSSKSSIPHRKRGKIEIISPGLAASLDRTKVSDRKAVLILAETAKSLGQNVEDLTLNRSTIRRKRQYHRSVTSVRLKEEFRADVPLVVHWDGKMISDLTGKETIDQLPILVSAKGVSQLLTAAKLISSTGQAQAAAVHTALQEWGIVDRVRAMSFDTTSSNTGGINGACVILEQMLGVKLLSLACRHHIFEVVIGAVFQVCMGSSSAPEVLFFKRFKSHWQFINQAKYETGMDDTEVASIMADVRENILEFAEQQLRDTQPRDDYREFLELSVIFLGGVKIN